MTFVDLLMVLDYRQSIMIIDLEKKGNDAFSYGNHICRRFSWM